MLHYIMVAESTHWQAENYVLAAALRRLMAKAAPFRPSDRTLLSFSCPSRSETKRVKTAQATGETEATPGFAAKVDIRRYM